MKTLLFSDVHGNLPALERMLSVETNCESFICLGDVVNYGPWSNECVELVCSLPNSKLLMGNHEDAFINGFYPGKNRIAQQFFDHNIEIFKEFDAIKNFLQSCKIEKYTCQHTIFDQYIYQARALTLIYSKLLSLVLLI